VHRNVGVVVASLDCNWQLQRSQSLRSHRKTAWSWLNYLAAANSQPCNAMQQLNTAAQHSMRQQTLVTPEAQTVVAPHLFP
jgi:hypothetical protein